MFVAICILSGRDTKVNTIAVSRSEKAAIDALIDFLVDNYLLVDWTLADPEKSKYENHFFISNESTKEEMNILKYFLKMRCQSFQDLRSVCLKHTFDEYYGQTWSIILEVNVPLV